jgi:hypothetical protein
VYERGPAERAEERPVVARQPPAGAVRDAILRSADEFADVSPEA